MTTLYIIRHGYSVGNAEQKFSGRTDFPLTEEGRVQAERTAAFLKSTPLDVLVSSPLCRARETAAPIAKSHGLEIVTEPDLAEICLGKLDGMPIADAKALYPEVMATWYDRLIDAVLPDGESVRDCAARAVRVLHKILDTYKDKRVCVVSHGALIKFMFAHIKGIPFDEMDSVSYVNNASVSAFVYDGEKFEILYENKCDQMGDLVTGVPRALTSSADTE
ncbi:MAG: histidine phosphatase family protein [Clostridia bacterium]|nr:histidine phosphatase family protein [Clostridia bacterium]